jgi:hypothetical protein
VAPLVRAVTVAAEDDRDVVMGSLPEDATEAIRTNENSNLRRPLGEDYYHLDAGEVFRWPLDAWERAVAAIQIVLVDRGCEFPWSQRRYIIQEVAVFCSQKKWPDRDPNPDDVATWPQLRAALARRGWDHDSDVSTTSSEESYGDVDTYP